MHPLYCRQCGAQLKLEDDWAGNQGRCPQCDCVVGLPRAVPPPPPPLAPPWSPLPRPPPPPSPPPKWPVPQSPPVGGSRPWSWRAALAIAGGVAAAVIVLGLMAAVVAKIARPRPAPEVADAPGETSEPAAATDLPEPRQDVPGPAAAPSQGPAAARGKSPSVAGSGRAAAPRDVADGGPGPEESAGADPPRREAVPEGLTGVSRQYDDLECRRLQARHGIRVPPGATILEVDGVRLPVVLPAGLTESPAPILLLPPGSHTVSFRPDEKPVTVAIASSLSDEYQAMRKFFGVGGTIRKEELLSRSARVMDVHGTPFLLNFSGAQYAAAGDWGAAERKFRRALGINPLFAPAHLNLAECLLRRSAQAEAAREIVLAEAFNLGNVFGLAGAIGEFRRRLTDPRQAVLPIAAAALSYRSAEPLGEEDRRLAAVLEGAAKYAVRDEERAKILNNLAVHFAESGRPELALFHFRNALACLLGADPEQRYRLARRVLGQMGEVCRKAGFGEAEEYRQMSVSLTGAVRSAGSP